MKFTDSNSSVRKRDVRLQVFVTADVDDRLTDMCEIMGLSKNEMIRQAIGQMLLGFDSAIKVVKDKAQES